MKAIITALVSSVFFVACTIQAPVSSQVNTSRGNSTTQQGVLNSSPVPNGIYYIVQASSGDAITPKGVTQVTNEIHLRPFNLDYALAFDILL